MWIVSHQSLIALIVNYHLLLLGRNLRSKTNNSRHTDLLKTLSPKVLLLLLNECSWNRVKICSCCGLCDLLYQLVPSLVRVESHIILGLLLHLHLRSEVAGKLLLLRLLMDLIGLRLYKLYKLLHSRIVVDNLRDLYGYILLDYWLNIPLIVNCIDKRYRLRDISINVCTH